MTVHGYVLRIRCDTEGAHRRVMIGTQLHSGTQWFALEECRLESWGLSTPAVENIRRLRATHRPITGPVPRTPRPVRPARPVAAPQAQEDRNQAFAALQRAVDDGRGLSELRHCLNLAEATAHGGATAAENALLRAAGDMLLRLERGVGVSAPAVPSRRRGRQGERSAPPGAPVAPAVKKAGSRQAAQAVSDLLDSLNRRRGRLTPAAQLRLVNQLTARAQEAGNWLTSSQRAGVAAWESTPPPAPRPAVRPVTVPPPPAADRSGGSVRTRQRSARDKALPIPMPTELDTVAEAARDVLEHAARLGKTITYSQLCAQVKGLAALSSDKQRQALKQASSPSGCADHHGRRGSPPALPSTGPTGRAPPARRRHRGPHRMADHRGEGPPPLPAQDVAASRPSRHEHRRGDAIRHRVDRLPVSARVRAPGACEPAAGRRFTSRHVSVRCGGGGLWRDGAFESRGRRAAVTGETPGRLPIGMAGSASTRRELRDDRRAGDRTH